MGLKGLPPIPSKHFVSLTSPGNLTEALAGAASDMVTVVKYQAPWCRTCRAMAPLLDRQAEKHQELRYFSFECRRDGKAAGERMHKFFVERGAKGLPFVEVYRGNTLLEVTKQTRRKRNEGWESGTGRHRQREVGSEGRSVWC